MSARHDTSHLTTTTPHSNIGQTNRVITTHHAPPSLRGHDTQATVYNNTVYLSGTLGIEPHTHTFAGPGISDRMHQALDNVGAILQEAGSDLKKILKVTLYINDMADYPVVNRVYERVFSEAGVGPESVPARTCVAVKGMPLKTDVVIDCVAFV
ncbi:protein mmf1, mitochondrial precursor [Peziza echinospora]|nr:protein mmf1, mitochondrial precursor [Peziza echinospora]